MERITDESERKPSFRFAETYLRQDGVFALKLIAKNSTDLVGADIVCALWDHYNQDGAAPVATAKRNDQDQVDEEEPPPDG